MMVMIRNIAAAVAPTAIPIVALLFLPELPEGFWEERFGVDGIEVVT